jgi:RNA polymerase sigma-70 factor (ECF subfamily)
MTDVDLVKRAAAGDMDAFGSLYERYYSVALETALRVTRSRAIAEDAVHELFLWLAEGRWRIDPAIVPADGRVDGFVRTLARFAAFKVTYRVAAYARRAVENYDDDGSTLARLHSRFPNPETQLIEQELRDRLSQSLDALPPQLRRVAYFRYIEELCGPDIAERIGVTPGVIPSYLVTIRRKLRAALAGYITVPPASVGRGSGGHRRFARRLPEPVH